MRDQPPDVVENHLEQLTEDDVLFFGLRQIGMGLSAHDSIPVCVMRCIMAGVQRVSCFR